MLEYPVDLTRDDNSTVLASVNDVPGVHSFGADEVDALRNVADALASMLAVLKAEGSDFPRPSPAAGRPTVCAS